MNAIPRPHRGGNRAKLTDAQVRHARISGMNRRTLAREFKVSPQTIDNIRARRTWWWLP